MGGIDQITILKVIGDIQNRIANRDMRYQACLPTWIAVDPQNEIQAIRGGGSDGTEWRYQQRFPSWLVWNPIHTSPSQILKLVPEPQHMASFR